jgi:hypothetical protein
MSIIVGNLFVENNENLFKEEKEGDMYIGGIFAGADKINNNKRVYPEEILDRAMEEYLKEKVQNSMGAMELGHPDSPRINLDRIAAKIIDLKKDGKEWVGKAKILKELPCGHIAYGLLKNDMKIGSSTRALGSAQKRKWMESEDANVVDNLVIRAIDLVSDPSYSPAMVDVVAESKQFILDKSSGSVFELNEETYKRFESQINNLPQRNTKKQEIIFESIKNFLNSLKSNG